MERVYILIEIEVGKTKHVTEAISRLIDVVSVNAITGPYDAIAIVECENISELGDCITSKIHTISGIQRTVSCIATTSS